MKNTPSTDPETLRARAAEIARKIAAECVVSTDPSRARKAILSGDGDNWHGVKSALAAIIHISELAAKCAEQYPSTEYADIPVIRGIAHALRAGAHLQGNPHDD